MATAPLDADTGSPLQAFSRGHDTIVAQLQRSALLPSLLDAARQARAEAEATLRLFERVVLPHHAEEEADLFPAVRRSARPEERELVDALIEHLTHQHRWVEAQWKKVAPAVERAAKGQPADVDETALGDLVAIYLQHASTEEEQFLPLAGRILSRNQNHMAALGVSLHMRHVRVVPGYI